MSVDPADLFPTVEPGGKVVASSSWWAIGANVQPVAGVGTSYTYFYGTQAAAEARAKTVVDGTVTGPFSTEADAKAAVAKGQTAASPQAAETPSELGSQVSSGIGTLASFLGVGSVSGTNLVIRGLKVIIGGIMLLVGLVHITGVGGDIANAARKVPLPI